MPLPIDEYSLLYRCLSERKWRDLSASDFARKYEEEVGDLGEIYRTHAADLPLFGGQCLIHELPDGLVALEVGKKWSLYETEQRARSRDHLKAWAEFARGFWHSKAPQEPGLYFCKDVDEGRRCVRELKFVNRRLKDVTGGTVRVGLVTEYKGLWWMPKVPPLPGSF